MSRAVPRLLAAFMLAMLPSSPAAAQLLSDELPGASYYVAVQSFYAGEYREAERALQLETRRGLRTTQARWVDSICYHAMLGEVLYHQGRNAEALAQFDQACQLLLAYPNWLLQVQFKQLPRPDLNRARRAPPWGRSERQVTFGLFPSAEQVLFGDLNAARAVEQGGVVAMPMLWRVNVAEIVRTSALAIRRRNELLGPLGAHDRISRDLAEVLTRGNLAPANHWSGVWVSLLRGLAHAGVGKLDEAEAQVGRGIVVDGQFDHPLTCVALLEQGRLAMARGESRRAAPLLAEAGFSAYYFDNWDVICESIWLGWLNHLASGGAGVYPPLEPVAAWARTNGLDHLTAKLRVAHAESLVWLGQADAAAVLLEETARRIGQMRGGLTNIHLLYGQANLQLVRGQVAAGSEALGRALATQAVASPRNFRLLRTNEMFDAGAVSPRVALDLYGALLADPAAADWLYEPLDAMAVMQTPQEVAYERWFAAALARKEPARALEVAEQAKRRRYLSSLALGGRLAALRTILEAPERQLSRDAQLQRQQILAAFPAYRTLAQSGQQVLEELRKGPVLAATPAETKALAALYGACEKNVNQRQQLLAQLAPRRIPAAVEFPPLRNVAELQQTLGEGEALVVFHAPAAALHGFVVTRQNVHWWQVRDLRRLRAGIGEFVRALGNFGPNRTLSVEDLASDTWRELAAAAYKAIFAESRLDVSKTRGLIIVPDDALWYLPFEALVPDGAAPEKTLADLMTIRCGPTASLAVANQRPLRRARRTGIVANKLAADEAPNGKELVEELEKVVPGPVRLPSPLPQPPQLVEPLLDALVALDDVEARTGTSVGWSPLPKGRGAVAENAAVDLPYGGPERVIVTGFATEAEQGLRRSRRDTVRRARPGEELFQSLCGLMADGARTVLLTRWRTGGQTNFELVREFVRELPHALPVEAWQRACVLAREAPLDVAREPRIKVTSDAVDMPTANHPFFWAAYVLVDAEPRQEEVQDTESAEKTAGAAEQEKKVSPPIPSAESAGEGK